MKKHLEHLELVAAAVQLELGQQLEGQTEQPVVVPLPAQAVQQQFAGSGRRFVD